MFFLSHTFSISLTHSLSLSLSLSPHISYLQEAKVIARKKFVQLVLLNEGIYDLEKDLTIIHPISIHGAGQDKTIIQGYGIKIKGEEDEEGKRVSMQDVTFKGSKGNGLSSSNGLDWLCTRTTFTECGGHGVGARTRSAQNTKGRLINCAITQCCGSGIHCGKNALIEMEGCQTKVNGNGWGNHPGMHGLTTTDTSARIHLLFPLTKDSVGTPAFTNNHNGRNYGSFNGLGGTIETVASFEAL